MRREWEPVVEEWEGAARGGGEVRRVGGIRVGG